MTRQAGRIIEELSTKFPEWTFDFKDFVQWQHYGSFGTDELGFFISADLMYPEYLRRMDDRFWFYIAELTRFGELDLWEHRA
jgi:hypothetical protein